MNKLIAFSNPTRLRLISCIGSGEKNVTELIGNCCLSQSAVSQHLMKLRAEGIVKVRREGRMQLYSLIDPKISDISRDIIKLLRIK